MSGYLGKSNDNKFSSFLGCKYFNIVKWFDTFVKLLDENFIFRNPYHRGEEFKFLTQLNNSQNILMN